MSTALSLSTLQERSGFSLPDTSPKALAATLPEPLRGPAELVIRYIQKGAFQRSLALLAAGSSFVSMLEVGYEHYLGSYSNPVMYTPVALSGMLSIAGVAAFFSRRMARTFLRWTSYVTIVDGLVGFGFHIRGVARKPGGWRMPIINITMGPPLFAPLLFTVAAYLGMIASYLQREEDLSQACGATSKLIGMGTSPRKPDFRDDIRVGRFQKHLSVITAAGTLVAGAESWYSHYKDNFNSRPQWTPIVMTPLLSGAALLSVKSETAANTLLPLASAAAVATGMAGTGFHIQGILRKAGGLKKPLYNIIYGPPIFAPMLFAACGLLGGMAYLMRRERH